MSFEIDRASPAPLTRKRKAELAALAHKPDEEIDCSDIPQSPPLFWEKAVPRGFYRPIKRQMTVRIDADILEWLKSQGKGYHSRLNQILRSAMLHDLKGRTP